MVAGQARQRTKVAKQPITEVDELAIHQTGDKQDLLVPGHLRTNKCASGGLLEWLILEKTSAKLQPDV